jgi:hypothetical protein
VYPLIWRSLLYPARGVSARRALSALLHHRLAFIGAPGHRLGGGDALERRRRRAEERNGVRTEVVLQLRRARIAREQTAAGHAASAISGFLGDNPPPPPQKKNRQVRFGVAQCFARPITRAPPQKNRPRGPGPSILGGARRCWPMVKAPPHKKIDRNFAAGLNLASREKKNRQE